MLEGSQPAPRAHSSACPEGPERRRRVGGNALLDAVLRWLISTCSLSNCLLNCHTIHIRPIARPLTNATGSRPSRSALASSSTPTST